ncbi:fimbrial protein, partial [Salmonella enterica]|nr:fimbrial protein [Salmonella enterica]
CGVGESVKAFLPLSHLTDSSLRQLQGVYGAGIVAGSGELALREGAMPARWKSTLNVSIEYQ